jgi:hypothetical protein
MIREQKNSYIIDNNIYDSILPQDIRELSWNWLGGFSIVFIMRCTVIPGKKYLIAWFHWLILGKRTS